MIILIFVVINVSFMFIYFNKPSEDIPEVAPNITPETEIPEPVEEPSQNVSNETSQNETSNITLYEATCINSTKDYVKNIENITNITITETRFFDKEDDAIDYVKRNWSSPSFEIEGFENETIGKTAVCVFDIITNRQRNFILPILCNENGRIGNYSSCLLANIPNIPSACYNFTINFTECEIEWKEHQILDDIEYEVNPPGAAFLIGPVSIENKTEVIFNFTISSSRQRLEHFGMNIIQRTFTPMINDEVIFSSTKLTPDGKGGTLKHEINITNMKNIEFYATVWFKKKCYDKYVIY